MTEPLAPDDWAEFDARLQAFLRRRVAAAAADDLRGEILLRLVEHQDALKAAQSPAAWIYRVAANALADHHRRRSAETRAMARLALQQGIDQAAAEPAPLADEGAAAELARCLIPLIRGLPKAYGEALSLTEIEGLNQAAAAERLGLSPSGMKSRVQRGRAKLKQAPLRCCRVEVDRRGGVLDYRARQGGCDRAAGCR